MLNILLYIQVHKIITTYYFEERKKIKYFSYIKRRDNKMAFRRRRSEEWGLSCVLCTYLLSIYSIYIIYRYMYMHVYLEQSLQGAPVWPILR